MEDEELTSLFEQAAAYLRGIAGKLDSKDLLYFYARFKQAKEGPNKTTKPGFFDFQGKQKWQAWSDLKDMPQDQAMAEYVEKLTGIDPEWEGKEVEKERSWMAVSSMQNTEEELEESDMTVFDWVKKGDLNKVKALVSRSQVLAEGKDAEGMSLLHWAADRGSVDMTRLLLEFGCQVDGRDGEGQTALHYASSCGHVQVTKLLLKTGADQTICDGDGLKAVDVAADQEMKDILKNFSK